ncbi:phage tail protein [Bradyrhizobium sp. UFLA 03-164]|uniref:Phage tail protein n=2 Tax=Bradyrhizobium uaiense TaxID=2594946 RepID=A0A6P1B8U4_9BRAD|nr:phage tail protein [Bradyrhizobium uaiense]
MPLYRWSQTANSNASADPSINWSEGQAPSSINDSARATMAAVAQYRDDISGAIVTTGTSTAYVVSTFSQFDSLADMNKQMVAFTPHVTNGAGPVLLNVDSLGQKALRTAPGVELSSGTIVQGTPYCATYSNSDGAWYLHGFFGNPYNVPLAAGMDYWGSATPNSSFAFPAGQAISRTTYATLFSLIGTGYGGGDGSTTFNLPDKRGRVSAGVDNMGGTYAYRFTPSYFGSYGTLGVVGGGESHTLSLNEIPSHAHANTLSDPGHTHPLSLPSRQLGTISANSQAPIVGIQVNNGSDGSYYASSSSTGVSIANAYAGGSAAHAIVQPTICCNYIMRII